MFFSIAVSRVAPVLFPDASGDPSSLFLAQNAAAILEKVKNVDRERKSVSTLSSPFLSKKTSSIVHGIVETQMLSVKPLGSKRTADPDEHTLELLTREMEHLVIENRLTAVPAISDLGRARSNVVKRVKAQAQEKPRLSRRTLSQSQRSIGSGQLPSPVSPVLKPFGGDSEVEVIDVDALTGGDSRPIQRRVIGSKQESPRLESGPMFVTYIRARSKIC